MKTPPTRALAAKDSGLQHQRCCGAAGGGFPLLGGGLTGGFGFGFGFAGGFGRFTGGWALFGRRFWFARICCCAAAMRCCSWSHCMYCATWNWYIDKKYACCSCWIANGDHIVFGAGTGCCIGPDVPPHRAPLGLPGPHRGTGGRKFVPNPPFRPSPPPRKLSCALTVAAAPPMHTPMRRSTLVVIPMRCGSARMYSSLPLAFHAEMRKRLTHKTKERIAIFR